MKQYALWVVLSLVGGMAIFLSPAIASAHVIVTPGQTDVAQELVFSVSVPNERQIAVTNLKLTIPTGVTGVVPTVKDGWTIKTDGSGDNVTAITWSGGQIPVGQREDFSFSAQVPAKAGELDWKAYQTYDDGTVVHWDQKPNGSDDASGDAGPYSVTQVVNDLGQAATPAKTDKTIPDLAFGLSVVAVLLALAAFAKRK